MNNRKVTSIFKIFIAVLLLFAVALSVCSCANSMKKNLKQSTSDILNAIINKDQAAITDLLKDYYATDEIELMYADLVMALDGVSNFKIKRCKYEIVEVSEQSLVIMTATVKTNKGEFIVETHTYTRAEGISNIIITPAE